MRTMDRRTFLKVVGAGGAMVTGVGAVADRPPDPEDAVGVLVDTTRCAGCRNCEVVCAETHGLPEPDLDDSVLDRERDTSETQWSVINRFETSRGEVFVKRQCMHCLQPACTAACLTRAMYKTETGPVVWRGEKCMGCRFCMVSCPFDVPKFEYHSANPEIQKCRLCFDRLAQGQLPACVENCPAEALTFGKRSELILEAHRRFAESPDDYYPEIYGEREVGGTTWMYLAAVPFRELGFRVDLGQESYPTLTREFLYGVPVVLTVLPAFLLALNKANQARQADDGGEE